MNKLKLTPLNSLMVKWAKETMNDNEYYKFIDHLDLSAGNELFDEINDICDWYSEVNLNKKHFIDNSINETLNSSGEEHLIIILSSGNYPHSLEILHNHCDKVNRIIEIDKNGMEEKQELYDTYFPECADKIKCISADISSKAILDLVSNLIHEYYQETPCLIILDNATYSLKISNIKNIISSFKSSGKKNTLILDSLKTFSLVSNEKCNIPNQIIGKLNNYSDSEIITPLDQKSLNTIIEEVGGELENSSDLFELEKDRVGENTYFNSPDDGWMECSVWKI